MRLARFRGRAAPRWGFVEGDHIHPVAADAPPLIDSLVGRALPGLRATAGHAVPISEIQLLAPIERPGKVICVGLNYRAHAEESGLAIPAEPLLFMKYPNSVTGPRDNIVLPPESNQVDWEVELAAIIGSSVERVDRTDALAAVAGFAIAIDVSARDLQARDGQWVRAKSFRTFCPLGPWITTADEIGDGSGLDILLSVNNVVKQESNTSDLIADVATIVRHASNVGALEPGDVVLTGTPAGTGAGLIPPEFLIPGDIVRARISGLGELINRVVAYPNGGAVSS